MFIHPYLGIFTSLPNSSVLTFSPAEEKMTGSFEPHTQQEKDNIIFIFVAIF